MKAVRRHATRIAPTEMYTTQEKQTDVTTTRLQRLRLLASNQLSQLDTFDITTAYTNKRNPTYQTSAVFHQCMNAMNSTPKTTPRRKKGAKMKARIVFRTTRRTRMKVTVSPITVKGTPDQNEQTKTGEEDDLSLYYTVFNRYKPEAGESNAESAARTTAFEAEYHYLLMKRKTKTNKMNKNRIPKETAHSLSPSTPPTQTVIFQGVKDKATLYQNNVQEVPLDTDYYLYNTPDQPIKNQPINTFTNPHGTIREMYTI